MSNKFEKHIKLEHEQTALECLSEKIALSKQQLKKLMQNGAVWLENDIGIHRVRRARKKLQLNNQLHVYYDAKIQATEPPEAKLISDEGDYSIWNKPSGMYSQGTKWGDHCTINRWAEQHLLPQRPAFIVHRLDKAANGLIIIAHKKNVAEKFSRLFECREIYKKYRVQVEGVFKHITLPYEINAMLDDKQAISEIISLTRNEASQQTLVDITIKTGRKHQIRRHLSEMGYPIVGDRLYHAKNIHVDLQLSSVSLDFKCPVTGVARHYELVGAA
ncbi:Pseudouridine synthase [hydrothermal vent metagenome]|uniref:Pseudouridine synthase n=1 Tax=hydrothermal vent metagenome TaxID=652676 RepID=A0A3B0X8N7_9ZZZZ